MVTEGGKVEGQLKPVNSELSQVQGILLKGCKIVIPASMKREMLEKIHQGHLGINKCKARARETLFWPGMNSDIETFVQKCDVCRKYAYSQPREPLLMRTVPDQAWCRVGIDIFHYGGKPYLCIYDSLSNFPEVELLKDASASTVIDVTSAIFARYGIPMEVCSDNGPPFSSHQFQAFAREYDFRHTKSSPRYPQSNGLAEKGVQVVKRILKKTAETKQDFWLGLLAYRTTPLEGGASPAEILQGRKLRTTLPDFQGGPAVNIAKHRQTSDNRQTLRPLSEGDVVRVKKHFWDTKARVLQRRAEPRSYDIITEEGKLLRRNRSHLMRTKEAYRREPADDSEDDSDAPSEESVTAQEDPVVVSSENRISGAPVLRPQRQRGPPRRLAYDRNFEQIA